MSLVLLPALADPFEEFLLVLFHQPDEGLVFRFLVPPGPQHHFGQHWRKINPFWRQPVNELSPVGGRSEEHTSELQSRLHLVCRLLLEKKKKNTPQLRT